MMAFVALASAVLFVLWTTPHHPLTLCRPLSLHHALTGRPQSFALDTVAVTGFLLSGERRADGRGEGVRRDMRRHETRVLLLLLLTPYSF